MPSTDTRAPAERPKPRQQRSRKTVERVIEAANVEFAERGSSGVTTTSIASRAQVSVGALYRFFPDKQSIARALSNRYLDDARARFLPVLRRARSLDDIPEILSEVIRVAGQLHLDHPGYYRLTQELPSGGDEPFGQGVRTAMVDAIEAAVVELGASGRAQDRRRAIELAIETVRHTLATAPTDPEQRSRLIEELTAMVVPYTASRLGL